MNGVTFLLLPRQHLAFTTGNSLVERREGQIIVLCLYNACYFEFLTCSQQVNVAYHVNLD